MIKKILELLTPKTDYYWVLPSRNPVEHLGVKTLTEKKIKN